MVDERLSVDVIIGTAFMNRDFNKILFMDLVVHLRNGRLPIFKERKDRSIKESSTFAEAD